MKLPLNWVKDYAKIDTTVHEYAEKMTMSGSKVESTYCLADEISNVVVAKVLKIEPHPDAEKLLICQLDVGTGEDLQIVTGAKNLKVGDLVPVALDNSTLPGGKKIFKGKLRGVDSFGMMCSLGELNLTINDFPNASENGILVLDEEVEPGTDISKALGLDDTCVEFEITPNRPDCLSIRGLSRETAATYGVEFIDHIPEVKAGSGDVNEHISVEILNDEKCSRYTGAVVQNVRVANSPRWLRERLRVCGVRPINNIVDITNYVMLEYGHPMHAFDISYVNGNKITVRNAKENEEIVTLDGITRTLTTEMLVIADEKAPIAVAGVMGGEFSGVYENTNTIVFEAACFDGPSVRTTAKKIGLRTEASSRFEKGLNPENCLPAIKRALELIVMLDAGDVVNGIVDVYKNKREVKKVKFEPDVVNKLLGTNVSTKEMEDILLPLNLKIEDGFVIVPPERYDISRSCDIAEEVARFVGYNKIPSTIMRGVATARPTLRQTFNKKVINTLIGYGAYECETFSFYSPKCFDLINLNANNSLRNAVVISNPLGEDTGIMRTTAIPSIMDVITRNCNARLASAVVFENATEYIPNIDPEKLPIENEKIILACYGEGYDYFYIKGILEKLLLTVGVSDFDIVRNESGETYHPGRTADIFVAGVKIATLGEVHPLVLTNYKIKQKVCVLDISLDNLFICKGETRQYKQLPKFPAITRDLALVAKQDVPAIEILKGIKKGAGEILESVTLFDIYQGDKIEQGYKSLAYNIVLRSNENSLTDENADNAVKEILNELSKINVVLRS